MFLWTRVLSWEMVVWSILFFRFTFEEEVLLDLSAHHGWVKRVFV